MCLIEFSFFGVPVPKALVIFKTGRLVGGFRYTYYVQNIISSWLVIDKGHLLKKDPMS